VLADAGGENVNAQVDTLIAAGVLRRLLAITELKYFGTDHTVPTDLKSGAAAARRARLKPTIKLVRELPPD
jgi:hypothetical protein